MINSLNQHFLINFQGRKPKYTNQQKQLAMRFADEGLTLEDTEKIFKRFPKLKSADPYSMEYNIREFAKLYENEGLTVKQHLENAKKMPSLFASKPETLSNNIDDLYKFVSKYGITKKQIIELQNKIPVIRAMSANTLIRYMTDIPKRYKKSGLSEKEYVSMAMKDIFLITTSLERFEGNMNSLLEYYSDLGVTERDLIKTFKKQRMLATTSPAKIIEKIDLWRFIEENKIDDSGKKISKRAFKDLLLRKNLSHSTESNLLYLLRCKLNSYHGTDLSAKKIKEQLTAFLKQNSEKTFEIPVLKGVFTESFEKVISDFSINTLGKNVFKVILK